MQGQGSSVESLPETFEFEHGSSSSTSGMDQQVYWNNMLLSSVESHSLPDYLVSPGDPNMPYINMANQDGPHLNIWRSPGASSSEHTSNHGARNETKLEHVWAPAPSANMGGGLRIEGRHFETASTLSLGNVNINLNTSQSDDVLSFPQSSNLNDVPQNPEQNGGHIGVNSEVSELRLCPHPYNSVLLDSGHDPSSIGPLNHCGSSSGGLGFMADDIDGRPGNPLDGRRLACKRKNTEGVQGQSSASGSASFYHQNDNNLHNSASSSYSHTTDPNIIPSNYISFANSTEEQLPGFGTIMRRAPSDRYEPTSVAGNAGSSQRSFRIRTNSAQQHEVPPPNLWSSENAVRHFNIWTPNQPSSNPNSFNQMPDPRPPITSSGSLSQPHVPVVPGFPQTLHHLPWTGACTSRVVNSPNSASLEGRILSTREEPSGRNVTLNNFSDLTSPNDMRHLGQEPTNWSLAGRGTTVGGNVSSAPRAGTSSMVSPPLGPTWLPHQNMATRYPRSLSEVVHRSLFSLPGTESGSQSTNIPMQHSGHSVGAPEIGHQSRTGIRGRQPPRLRSAFLLDRQGDGILDVPLTMRTTAAAREGRSRMISEIRNALESMRRGDNLRFEDVFILDQSMFYGGVDLHDRHRDMRLDVDNMSYEELLALEERIGNVNTGLGEEIIAKHLKQRKHSSGIVEACVEDEPCCICQEEYADGEDLGILDCGHDFHTACIKQWLMHKNLCPICKNTALVT
ncbi:probable E3 ubiquitin-protein ligase HIP1 isoform X2 [Typha latifolia]|uniref:probable E3 ubiquitin-protein ligase HIP1 isoform X2 n=1 Tax=Typha latifolia TaxID=4733 RepID=UPI003C2E0FBA